MMGGGDRTAEINYLIDGHDLALKFELRMFFLLSEFWNLRLRTCVDDGAGVFGQFS